MAKILELVNLLYHRLLILFLFSPYLLILILKYGVKCLLIYDDGRYYVYFDSYHKLRRIFTLDISSYEKKE